MTALEDLTALVGAGGVVVLSGAGLSTESGIPDYRGPSGAASRRHTPMTYQAFVRDPVARHRYWARGFLGWRTLRATRPNTGHLAVAELERRGLVVGTVTQNVDGLHQAAGSRRVVDLHGRLDRVVCLDCDEMEHRDELDARLGAVNTGWAPVATASNPDGDVELPEDALDGFTMVGCRRCGGVLKPDVVYFGENVPAARVEQAAAMVDAASCLLVLGSSLTVFSGRRFVVRAANAAIPVAIVNSGQTRGDALASVKVDGPLGATLQRLVRGLPT